MLAITVAASGALCAPAIAQPTFGRPKQTKPRDTGDVPETRPIDSTAVPNDWNDADPPRLDPNNDAPLGVWHTSKTEQGFRYAWSYPLAFDKTKSCNVVIILHPANADFRWGMNSHVRSAEEPKPGIRPAFRARDIVISIDGMSADANRPSLRTFESTRENIMKFRDVVLEVSRTLPAQRIYLYGKGEGGAFALAFAQAFPALAEGVVCHAGEPGEAALVASGYPIVLVHGAKDQFLPLSTSVQAISDLEAAGHTTARLRVLRSFNDFTNPVRIDEAIDYIEAMRNQKPAESLAAVEKLLTPKPGDEYGYRTSPWFTAGYAALKRIEGKSEPKFATPADARSLARASTLMKAIDDEATAHVNALRALIGAGDVRSLALDGGAWLGYLLAFRDDFRGVPAADAFFRDFAWELEFPKHVQAARQLNELWISDATDAEKFIGATSQLPRCFLVESLPVDLLARARVCMRKADELDIPQDARDRFEFIGLWEQASRSGLAEYEKRWSRWRLPKAEPEPASAVDEGLNAPSIEAPQPKSGE